jgi:hypothetical protein
VDDQAALDAAPSIARRGWRDPIANFINLPDGTIYAAGSTVSLSFNIVRAYLPIVAVRLYLSGTQIATGDATTLSSYVLTIPAAGDYSLKIEAEDSIGNLSATLVSFKSVDVISTSALSLNVPTSLNELYQVRVRAVNESGTSAWTAWTDIDSITSTHSGQIPYDAVDYYSSPNNATIRFGIVAGATSFQYRVDGGTLSACSPYSGIVVALKPATQLLEIFPTTIAGLGDPTQITLDRLPPVQSDLKAWFNDNVATTAVSADFNVNYTTYNYVDPSLISSYVVYNAIISDLVSTYQGVTSVAQSFTVSYNVIATSAIANNLTSIYSVTSYVSNNLVINYSIFNSVILSVDAAYLISGGVASLLSSNYNIKSFVYSDEVASYSVLQSVQASSNAIYGIYNDVLASTSANYSIKNFTYKDITSSFGIQNQVANNLLVTYTIISGVSKDTTSNYSIINSIITDSVSSYSIVGNTSSTLEADYVVLSVSSLSSSLIASYSVQNVSISDLSTSYNIFGNINSDLISLYYKTSAAFNDLNSSFMIRGVVTKDLFGSYQFNSTINGDLNANYGIASLITNDLIAQYFLLSTSTGGGGGGNGDSAEVIWNYLLPDGSSPKASLLTIKEQIRELQLLHGLVIGEPLIVTPISRQAGTINQTINESATEVVVERQT